MRAIRWRPARRPGESSSRATSIAGARRRVAPNVRPRSRTGMKLASLKAGRDGALIVVSRDLARAIGVGHIAPTMQAALDDWKRAEPLLQYTYKDLNEGR